MVLGWMITEIWAIISRSNFRMILTPTNSSAYKIIYGHALNAPELLAIIGSDGQLKGNPDLKPEVIDNLELVWLYRQEEWRAAKKMVLGGNIRNVFNRGYDFIHC